MLTLVRNRVAQREQRRLALRGGEDHTSHDEQARNQPNQPNHLDVSHGEPPQTMSKRSVWTRSAGTPSSTSAVSAASIIGPGPQMKN
jgi:hypothetical protein